MIATNHRRPGTYAGRGGLLSPAQSSLLPFRLFLLLFFLFVVVFASGQTSSPAAAKTVQSTSAPAANAPPSEGSKYVGAETCKTCHEEIYNAWEKTPHWKTTLNTKGGPSKQGCEGCHGPGADHVAGGGDKTKIFVFEGKSRQETSARCLSCHGEAHAAVAFRRIRPLQQRCRMSRLPLAASRQGKRVPASPEPTPVVLRMPHLGQSRFRQTVSPPRQRGSGAMRRLPQPSWHGDRATAAEPAERGCHLLQVPCRQAGSVRLRACAGEDRGLHAVAIRPTVPQIRGFLR